MANHQSSSRYNGYSIVLHWLMFLLIASAYAFIELRVIFDKGTEARDTMKSLHYMMGMTVFILVWLRLLARAIYRRPPIQPAPYKVQHWAATVVHLALYVFMIGMPLAGWAMLSGYGDPVPFYGLELPALIGPDRPLAKQLQELHGTVGEVGYYVIGAHAAAALFHHYVLHNDTLKRMLPWRIRG